MSHPHLVDYINRDDVDVVLDRLPVRVRARVHNVHLTPHSRAVRRLGWVTRGRRDITLCATLPPRVGLHRYMYGGRVAADFGAPERGQWPPWAVRRFLLYNVLLHELGHMQVAGRRYAREAAAQAFADEWNGRLYSEPFDHPDPAHNAPTGDELATLPVWIGLDKLQRLQLTNLWLRTPDVDIADVSWPPLDEAQARFLRRMLDAHALPMTSGSPMLADSRT
jgi:hypothetical protein